MAALEAERSSWPRRRNTPWRRKEKTGEKDCPTKNAMISYALHAEAEQRPVCAWEDRHVDWDKLRVFHAAAEAGSFTHAGETLGLSQSAVSRQVGAPRAGPRHAAVSSPRPRADPDRAGRNPAAHGQGRRGQSSRPRDWLSEQREKPQGELRVTTTLGIGTNWLAPQLGEFLELYPEIKLRLILTDDELDLGMREADVGLRLRQPRSPT